MTKEDLEASIKILKEELGFERGAKVLFENQIWIMERPPWLDPVHNKIRCRIKERYLDNWLTVDVDEVQTIESILSHRKDQALEYLEALRVSNKEGRQ